MEASVIICDYAQVNSGKLYITGAAGNLLTTASAEAPHPISAWAGILITLPWQAHNQAHRLVISLVDGDGRKVPIAAAPSSAQVPAADEGSVVAQFNAGKSPIMQVGDESLMPLAIPLNLGVPNLGVYRLVLEIDGTEVAAARFRVVHPQQVSVRTL